MTETHKAAVEALEALLRHYGAGKTERECSLQNNAFQAIEYFRTLKHPSSVDVTVEKKQYYRSREFYIEYFASVLCRMDDLDPKRWRQGSETFEWTEFEQHAECILDAILQDFPSALRITRAAATDGVGNGET